MPRAPINIAIIALIALAVVALPGGSDFAQLVLAVVSLAFLAAIGMLGHRLYLDNKLTLWSLSTEHRGLLYGAIAVGFAALVATHRLWATGLGVIVWLALLGGAAFAIFHVWNESRRYRI